METIALITFLGGGSLVASLAVQLLKKLLSKISEKWGALVTQAVLFVVSLVIAGGMVALALVPENILLLASQIFLGAIALYEVLYKAIWQNLIKSNF